MDQSLKIGRRGVTDSQHSRCPSMTLLNTTESFDQHTTQVHKPRMATLQTLEAKMANIEESLSLSVASRRRKGTSLGSVSSRSSPKLDTIHSNTTVNQSPIMHSKDHHHQHHQDRETIMQNLRVQLGLDKHSGRSSSASISATQSDVSEKPANEQKLSRLRNDAENKKNAIRNLKGALQKLEMSPTLDIDSRIRQAELEYALGREELHLLSIVEEARSVQVRLEKEKSKSNNNSIFSMMRNGHQLTLHSVQASTGRWNANQKQEGEGFYVDWVMDGEELLRGDRIIEINGKVLSGRSKDELQKMCTNTTKCDLVVIRKRAISTVNVIPTQQHNQHNQQLQQTQADNMRLQHRISYLEEQVKELLECQKEKSSPAMSNGSQRSGTHITSISISSSPSDHDEDRPMTYQRGSFVTTIIGGKPQDPPPKLQTNTNKSVQKSSSTTNINGPYHHREQSKDVDKSSSTKSVKNLSSSMSKISISTDLHVQKQRRERERKERERYYNNKNFSKNSQQNLTKNSITASMNQIENSYSRRNKHVSTTNSSANGHDERSIKSLDFDSDTGQNTNYDEYASEPVPAPKIRPTPPKKPLRLSLQRARSLQAVCGNDTHSQNGNQPLMDTINLTLNDKKRAIKRIYRGENQPKVFIGSKLTNRHSKSSELSSRYIENTYSTPLNYRQRFV